MLSSNNKALTTTGFPFVEADIKDSNRLFSENTLGMRQSKWSAQIC